MFGTGGSAHPGKCSRKIPVRKKQKTDQNPLGIPVGIFQPFPHSPHPPLTFPDIKSQTTAPRFRDPSGPSLIFPIKYSTLHKRSTSLTVHARSGVIPDAPERDGVRRPQALALRISRVSVESQPGTRVLNTALKSLRRWTIKRSDDSIWA